MQNTVNDVNAQNVRSQGYPTVRNSFIRQASVVMISACCVLTLFYLFRTLISAFTSEMDPALASLYYFCGSGSVLVINLIAGILVLLFLCFFTMSLTAVYTAAKSDDRNKLIKGLKGIRNSLIYALIYAIFYTVIALSSVSVMYQAGKVSQKDEFAGQFINIGGFGYQQLFISTIVIGAAVITSIILFMRLSISMRRAAEGTDITTDGTISSVVISSVSAIIFLFAGFVALGRLVMPAGVGDTIQFSYIGITTTDIVINAALTTAFIAYALLLTTYTSRITVFRNMLYRQNFPYATNNYPQGPNRRPYVNPVARPVTPPSQNPAPQTPPPTQSDSADAQEDTSFTESRTSDTASHTE